MASEEADYLRTHRAHDVKELLRRWRAAVKGTDFRMRRFGESDGYPLCVIENAGSGDDGIYLSAGIHGDEPAPLWALLEWFEQGGARSLPTGQRVNLFPCLNPGGVVNNYRADLAGRDLNRLFDQVNTSPIREIRAQLDGRRYRVALCLHEDYDAQGIYVYDLHRNAEPASADALLKRVAKDGMPIDGRKSIDGRKASNGVIYRRRIDPSALPGLPEAVFLFLEGHARRTLTFETPSEYCLHERVRAHRQFIEVVIKDMLGGGR